MKLKEQYGLRFPLEGEAAAQLDKAAQMVRENAASAAAEQDQRVLLQSSPPADPLFEATTRQVEKEKAGSPAATETTTTTQTTVQMAEYPKMSAGAQLRLLIAKVFNLLFLRPVKAVGGFVFYPVVALKRYHDNWAVANPIKYGILSTLFIAGCFAAVLALAATPTTSMVRVHGGLENGGIFSRWGFALDNEKSTQIQVTGWAGNREVKATALLDSKGRYHTPGEKGGWFRHK